MQITSSYRVRTVRCSVSLDDTVRIYQEALSYLIDIVNDNWDAVRSITTGALEQQRYIEKLVHGNKNREFKYPEFVPAVILLIGKTPTSIRYTYVSCGGSRLPDTRGVTGKNI